MDRVAHKLWPIFDLTITTPRLEMRLATDDELVALTAIADESIFANSATAPFLVNWPLLPSPDREISLYQWNIGCRATWQPQNWTLPLVAFLDGAPIGAQAMEAKNFAKLRVVETGSWLGSAWQGQGLGTEMRAALLELAFAELDAIEAHSTARADNPRSARVSHKLGYKNNGVNRTIFADGAADDELRLRLTREDWEANRMPGVTVADIDACRHFFGGNGETWQTAADGG